MSDGQQSLFDLGKTSERSSGLDLHPEVVAHLLETGLSRGRVGLARELVALLPELEAPAARALFMAVIVGLEAQSQGSTFVPLPSAGDYFRRRLDALVPRQVWEERAGWKPERLIAEWEKLETRDDVALIGGPDDFRPLIIDGGRLYHQRMMLHEERLVDAVSRRLAAPKASWDSQVLEEAVDDVRRRQPPGGGGAPIRLNEEQQYAMLTALHQPLTLITGGPGTGKTSIVVSILRALVRLGVAPSAIALAAPTGKAANRMAQSIYSQLDALAEPTEEDRRLAEELEAPRTLHRLLGYSPRRDKFYHHANNPLSQRAVIVDEASMIDLFLMERLLGAVSPEARLVLLGDADQLPSVDTGAVLRDLIPRQVSTKAEWAKLVDGDFREVGGEGPTAEAAVRLETSYRMRKEDPAGRAILSFAQAVRDYDQGRSLDLPAVGELSEVGDGMARWEPEEPGELSAFVDWWFDHVILDGDRQGWKRRFNAAHIIDDDRRLRGDAARDVRQVLDHLASARILTLTRVYQTGSEALNEAFHRRMEELGSDRVGQNYRFHPGEPVMMLRNDYERNLFNGDQGVVVWPRSASSPDQVSGQPVVVFARTDGLVAFPLAELRDDLEHAFAMTVHKSQGSEFDQVALVLPTRRMALLNRELLYTGLTRARSSVLLVGAADMVAYGAAHRSERFSAIAEKLGA